MSKDPGNIWDWLLDNGKPSQDPPPAQDEGASGEDRIKPKHTISDLTLLALEREAEVASRMRQAE